MFSKLLKKKKQYQEVQNFVISNSCLVSFKCSLSLISNFLKGKARLLKIFLYEVPLSVCVFPKIGKCR